MPSEDKLEVVQLIEAAEIERAKALIQETIRSKRHSSEQWADFLQFVGVEKSNLQDVDVVQKHTFAVHCFEVGYEVSTSAEKKKTFVDLIAKSHNILGLWFADSGRIEEATKEFKKAIKLRPDNYFYHYNFGEAFLRSDRLQEAIEEFREAIKLEPNESIHHAFLGEAFLRSDRLQEAIEEFREAIKLEPNESIHHATLGYALLGSNRSQEAIEPFREAIKLEPNNPNYQGGLGIAFCNAGRFQEAIEPLMEAIKLEPNNPNYQYNLGFALVMSGSFQEAIEPLMEAIKLEPNNPNYQYNLGNALVMSGSFQEAIEPLKEAIKLEPNNPGFRYGLGFSFYNSGKFQEAIEPFEQAIKLEPNNPVYRSILGDSFRRSGKFEEAIEVYRETIKLKPDNSGYYYNLGNALADAGRFQEAIEPIKEAIKLEPNNPVYRSILGYSLIKCAKFEEAIEPLMEAIKLEPNNPGFRYGLGFSFYNSGKFQEAIEPFEQAIKLEANDPVNHSFLGQALYNSGRFQEAIEPFEQAIKLEPNNPNYQYNLGIAFYNSGRFQEAIEPFKKAIKLEPNDPYSHFNLGHALMKGYDYAQAKHQFEIAQEIFTKIGKGNDAVKSKALAYLSAGREKWQQDDLSSAESSYHLAAENFKRIEFAGVGTLLESVAAFFSIDKQILDALEESGDLKELEERMSLIKEQMARIKVLNQVSIEEAEIINAKTCFADLLVDGLEFKGQDSEKIQKAKDLLRKRHFFSAYHAVNALDSFLAELSQFSSLGEIDEAKQTDLLHVLRRRGATAIDGTFTREAYDRFVNEKLGELIRAVAKVETSQQTLLGKVEEVRELSQSILTIVQQNPERVQALLNEQMDELRQILLDTANQLKDRDPQHATQARIWYSRLAKGISMTADLLQIISFLTGIPSLPALANTDIAARVLKFLGQIRRPF